MDIKLKHPYLCTREECFYQEPFILSYYRRRLTFSQCLKSLFILHNETANVWTQIVGVIVFSLLFAYSLFSFLPSVTKGQENAMAQVLFFFILLFYSIPFISKFKINKNIKTIKISLLYLEFIYTQSFNVSLFQLLPIFFVVILH